jgi:solute carrier family 25 carnitine/acylcarnitine transporter 20/29
MSSSASSPQQIKDEVKAVEAKAVNQTIVQLRSLAAGAAGGLCAVVVGHPFDLVKVRLQTAEKGIYSGAMDVVRKTVAREGLARVGHLSAPVKTAELTGFGGRVYTLVYLPRLWV